MRKEVFVAIFLGSAIGLAIAFGIWRANKAFLPTKQEQTGTPSGSQNPNNEDGNPQDSLVITSPEDNSVIAVDKVTLEGASTPDATIVITSKAQEKILTADKDGVFKTDIELTGGVNQIKVSSFDKDGNTKEKTITVVYSTEFEETEE